MTISMSYILALLALLASSAGAWPSLEVGVAETEVWLQAGNPHIWQLTIPGDKFSGEEDLIVKVIPSEPQFDPDVYIMKVFQCLIDLIRVKLTHSTRWNWSPGSAITMGGTPASCLLST